MYSFTHAGIPNIACRPSGSSSAAALPLLFNTRNHEDTPEDAEDYHCPSKHSLVSASLLLPWVCTWSLSKAFCPPPHRRECSMFLIAVARSRITRGPSTEPTARMSRLGFEYSLQGDSQKAIRPLCRVDFELKMRLRPTTLFRRGRWLDWQSNGGHPGDSRRHGKCQFANMAVALALRLLWYANELQLWDLVVAVSVILCLFCVCSYNKSPTIWRLRQEPDFWTLPCMC